MARIYRRAGSNNWYIDYFEDGRRIQKSLHTDDEEEASVFLGNHISANKARRRGVKQQDVSYSQFRQNFLAFSRAEKAADTFRADLSAIDALETHAPSLKSIFDITPDLLLDIQKKLQKRDGNSETAGVFGRNRNIRAIKAAMRWAEEDQYDIPKQKWERVKLEDEPGGRKRWLTDGEIANVLGVAHAHYETAVLLGIYLGLRPGEIYHSRFDHINFDLAHYEVKDTDCVCNSCLRKRDGRWKPKNKQSRRVLPIPHRLLEHLKAEAKKAASPWIVRGEDSLQENSFLAYIGRLMDKAKIGGGACPYTLRHTFASHWVINEGDFFKLSKRLGHKTMDQTYNYAHLSDAAINETVLGRQILHPYEGPATMVNGNVKLGWSQSTHTAGSTECWQA